MTWGNSFVANGLAQSPMSVADRTLHVTIDFEAFAAPSIDIWAFAMERWAAAMERLPLPCTFFLSVEDAAYLRAQEPTAYRKLLSGLGRLHRAGAVVQPHNHRMFDLTTGRQFTPAGARKHVPGYTKQASLFYDVRHRQDASFGEWIPVVFEAHRTLCEDAEIALPRALAFRPGGWDCGSTADEQRIYLEAITQAGVVLHSGDSHGTYGTRDYTIESRFGQNVFRLETGVVEIAPCWAFNCGAGTISPQFAGAMLRLRSQPMLPVGRTGAFVAVLHFDHLFHRGWRSRLAPFSVDSPEEIRQRIDHSLGLLHRLSRVLRLRPAVLQDLEFRECTEGRAVGRTQHSLG
jgi:hypothetical protein